MKWSPKKIFVAAPFAVTIIFLIAYLDYGIFTENNVEWRYNKNDPRIKREQIIIEKKTEIKETLLGPSDKIELKIDEYASKSNEKRDLREDEKNTSINRKFEVTPEDDSITQDENRRKGVILRNVTNTTVSNLNKTVNLTCLETPFKSSTDRPYIIGMRKAFNENVVDIELTKHLLKCFNIETGLPTHLKNLFRNLSKIGAYGMQPKMRNSTILGDYYDKPYTKQSLGEKCAKNVTLSNFGPETSDENQIFFLETSGRGHLSPRQACAVESAARSSKLKVKVILLSHTLNLQDNITCHLHTHLSNTVSFHTVDLTTIFADTPLDKLEKSGKFAKSNFLATHYSDGLRLALVYKFGGFYSDLDVVVLHPLNTLINVIGQTSDNPKPHCHRHLANGEFHFKKGHRLLWKTMLLFQEKFRGKSRIEVGPMLITTVIKELYKHKWITDIKPSAEITLLTPEIFYPFKAFQAPRLWPAQHVPFENWNIRFGNAVMVHLYGSLTNNAIVTGDPRHEAYSLLGPHYCPLSFYGTKEF